MGQVAQGTRRYGLDDPGSISGGGRDFSSLFRVQIGPGAYSAFFQMRTGAFPEGKDVRATLRLPSAAATKMQTLHPNPLWASMACNEDTLTFAQVVISQLVKKL